MPAKTPELEMMDEDRLIEEVLDKFVNCHEQTYEEFLRTFTHLSKDNVTKREAFGTNSSENNFTSIKFTQRNEPNDCRLSNKAIFLHTSSQCSEEEQIMIGDGQKAGSSFQGDLNRAGKVKVDNFLDIEDLDLDEEINPQLSKDVLLLPGQVEQEVSLSVPSYIPSVAIQPVTPGTKPRPTVKAADKQSKELIFIYLIDTHQPRLLMALASDLYHLFYASIKGDQVQEFVKGSLLLIPNKNTRVFLEYVIVQVLVLSPEDTLLWKQSFNQK
ncbi:intraflagellar transport-associated protein isoform X1 [Bos taurus]|uniref:Intraflagellar transport associated protein n=1 Tax=Bos indicus x Bos taurus TaxID=30522 RepID=A0A4W2HV43_BOBOX|nr:intraflagellar transport-associated protein isoform X1 [Bos taurus]XP_010811088.1 intraflagellar transport-associated protein isoform X1 [Bos taurus]XP_010811089.1 intraflagellar transport-associated protein isoform X1 [Bos taurus]XP_010811090.1 intraflagellar transport-associated protein isoform X1 [Bos taurus]